MAHPPIASSETATIKEPEKKNRSVLKHISCLQGGPVIEEEPERFSSFFSYTLSKSGSEQGKREHRFSCFFPE